MTIPDELVPKRYIQRIQVEGLFGQLDHDLSFGEHKPDQPNLLVLYGENGTGKTNLLWLLYHLLNSEGKRGHRTYLAHQQFKRIAVTFTDGLEISAQRTQADRGSFELKATLGNAEFASWTYETDKEGKIPLSAGDDPVHLKFVAQLPPFNFGFLPHDRSTRIDTQLRRPTRATLAASLSEAEPVPIRESINGAITASRQQAIRASNRGQLTVNSIYTE